MGEKLPADGPWTGSEARWLACSAMGARFGAVVDLLVPPGAGYQPYRHLEHERVVYVWEGEGTHLGSGGPSPVRTDDVLVIPPGSWHGFTNDSGSPTRLWIAWEPTPTFPWVDYQVAAAGDEPDGAIIRHRLRERPEDPATTPIEQGFQDVGIIWDGADGARAIALGWAHFDPDGIHHMHRHPNADEAMCITVGSGMHVTPDRQREMIGAQYDPEFAAAGEWHRFDTGAEHTEGIFFYIGASTLEGTGYELMEDHSSGIAADQAATGS
jgi:quercetin dioxygenase-like cupin family protein